MQPCIKLAWDSYDWKNLAAYVEGGHLVAASMPANMTDDYMAVPSAACALLLDE